MIESPCIPNAQRIHFCNHIAYILHFVRISCIRNGTEGCFKLLVCGDYRLLYLARVLLSLLVVIDADEEQIACVFSYFRWI